MTFSGKKVLVTGADGFIGSHLTEELVRSGASVRAFVFYNAFNSYGWIDAFDAAVRDQLDIFVGDVRDPNGMREAVKDIDVVFHLAALIGIPFSYHSPDSYVDTNIKGTLNVLQAAQHHGVERVVHTSTSEVYGTAQFVPITEEHPLQAQSPYSATKIGADQIALSFFRSFETPVSVLRPFNTYGPRQSARAVIPTIISQLVNDQTEIELGNSTPTRDFVFVSDTVQAFIDIAKSEKALGQVVNSGTGFEISIGDLVNEIADLMNVKVKVETSAERLRPKDSEVNRLCADATLAKDLVGWLPAYTGLEGLRRGLEETIAWFSDSENIKRYKHRSYNI
ncbi:NAD-dependent 4,6-dehydratase LegB [Oligoflexia bacterium]|nr:NAD-dependent 4,6-dehydratase LegB [Oligoflexia bacterium]